MASKYEPQKAEIYEPEMASKNEPQKAAWNGFEVWAPEGQKKPEPVMASKYEPQKAEEYEPEMASKNEPQKAKNMTMKWLQSTVTRRPRFMSL